MKFIKYVLALSLVLCAHPGASNAQTIQFLGGGSSAMFLKLGQAAQSQASTGTPCVWTQGRTSLIRAEDYRGIPAGGVLNPGNIWVTWSTGSTGTCAAPSGTGINIYSYMSLDSGVGVMCYFAVQNPNPTSIPGCWQTMLVAAGTPGANLLCNPTGPCAYGPDTPIPQGIINALNNQRFFVAGTDMTPEDAKFAFTRMFTGCTSAVNRQPFDLGVRQTNGLGYGFNFMHFHSDVVYSFFNYPANPATLALENFNITGVDPFTGSPVPNYSVSAVGAKPIVVAVSPAGGTGIGAATDIDGFTLTLFLQGVLGRSTDLFGPTSTNPVTVLVPEPMSGAYNTMEYSVPNSSQFHASQDYDNCNSASSAVYANPMHLQSTNGQIPAFRNRVLGSDEMVTQLRTASADTLGYFYWSAANAAKFSATNGKYLTVDGVDPLQASYTDGVLPGVDLSHPLSNVDFEWVNKGDYPIWSVMRLVSTSPPPAGVTNLIAAANTLNATQHNFIPMSQLKVWHSHFPIPIIDQGLGANGTTINPATPGDLCNAPGALAETGAEAGGANVLKQANADFCTDFGNPNGLINKAN